MYILPNVQGILGSAVGETKMKMARLMLFIQLRKSLGGHNIRQCIKSVFIRDQRELRKQNITSQLAFRVWTMSLKPSAAHSACRLSELSVSYTCAPLFFKCL